MQLANPFAAIAVRRGRAETVRQMLECLLLPTRHLVGVHLVARRDLGYRSLTPNRL